MAGFGESGTGGVPRLKATHHPKGVTMAVSVESDVRSALPAGIGILLSEQGTTSTLVLRGECDLAAQRAVRDAVSDALQRGPECLVLDLSLVSFIDSTGIQVVVEAAKRASRQDTRMVILPGPRSVQRVFEICHLVEALPFIPKAEVRV